MKRNWARIAIGLLVVSCATKATKGLLEGDVPMGTLAKEGDLGFGRFSFPSREIPMPSGLRVAYETAPSRGMVTVVLALDVGSTLDPEGREGLAHYAEHLVFRNRTRGLELGLELQRLGARYNATTTLDATTYYALAPAQTLPALLDAMAGLLQKPLQAVAPADATLELEVVRSELALRNETGVYGQLRNWMQTLLVEPTHPYRRPSSGTSESVQRLTLQDARTFVDTHYKPEKATLLVAGDVDGEKLSELLKQRLPAALQGDPAHPVVREVGAVPLLNVKVPAAPATPPRHQAAVALPELWVGYLMPGKYSQNVGNTRLIASPATELRLREILEKDPDVVAVNLVPLHDRLATIMAIQVVLTSDKRRDEIADEVRRTVQMMWRPLHPSLAKALAGATQPTPVRIGERYVLISRPTPEFFTQLMSEHLVRLRFKGIADTLNGLEPWTERALERAGYLQVMGQPGALIWAAHQATLMEEQSVGEFASQFLTSDRARVAYLDPLPADRRPRAIRVGVSDRPITDDKSAAADYGQPFVAPAPPELANAREVRLENGLTVVIVQRSSFPAISAVLAFGGGAATSDPAGAVDLLRRLESLAGIALPFNAVEATPIDGPTFTGDLVRAGTRNLSNALYLLAQRIVDTDKTDWAELLDKDRSQSPLTFRVSPGQKASHLLRQSLYGSHSLARPPAGPEVLAIRGEHMERWIPRMRTPKNALLAIVGNVDPAEGERLARTWFGSWKGLPEAVPPSLPTVPLPINPGGIDRPPIVVDRDGDAQVELAIGCRLPPADARAQARYHLLANVLGSYVNTMVRYRAGAAYAINSETSFRGRGAADVLITLDLETRRLPEALAAVRTLWTRLGTEGFDPGAVSQSRWALSAGYNLRYETSIDLAQTLVENWSLGWPIDSLTRYPEELRNATAADLNAAFKICRDSTVSVVLGEKKAVDPVLASGR